MKYVALLRGINVGGNNKIDMKQLTVAMTKAGFADVSTYINSGNIFFSSNEPVAELTSRMEQLIDTKFGLEIKVLLRDKDNIDKLAQSIPVEWNNDNEMKCDVMFLWDKYNDKTSLEHFPIKPEVDDVKYVHGALIWKVDRKNVTKSGMMKLVGTDIYANMTIRNCNTVRKIQERLDS
jgi:uncharacterized protein (DUF1697 family)